MERQNIKNIFGIRILKTAIATVTAVFIGNIFDLNTPSMAGISAIVSMTNTVFDSYRVSINRMLSTLIGALIALFFLTIDFANYFTIFLGIVIIINICNYFNWRKATTLSCIVFLVIMLYEPDGGMGYFEYGIHRLWDTFVGLIVGFVVNRLVLPPDHKESMTRMFRKVYRELLHTMELFLIGEKKPRPESIYQDMNDINQEMRAIRNDRKFRINREVDLKQASEISALIYHGASLVIQLEEDGLVPDIDEKSRTRFVALLGRPVDFRESETSGDLHRAFNYYFDEFLGLMENLNREIRDFEQSGINKKEE